MGACQRWLETGALVFRFWRSFWIVRSFLYEPFQIPLPVHDDTAYRRFYSWWKNLPTALKIRIHQKTLIETGHPKRGDIVVFKYPEDPKLDYIKRAVGLPGDKITYDPLRKR